MQTNVPILWVVVVCDGETKWWYVNETQPEFFCFNSSLSHSEIEEEMEKAAQIKVIMSAFPRPLLIVMRYLFAFLNQ